MEANFEIHEPEYPDIDKPEDTNDGSAAFWTEEEEKRKEEEENKSNLSPAELSYFQRIRYKKRKYKQKTQATPEVQKSAVWCTVL